MATDIEIQGKEILRIRHRMNELMAQYTGQPIEEIEKNVERDKFFSAGEAKEFGLVDELFVKSPAPSEEDASKNAALRLFCPSGLTFSFRKSTRLNSIP